MDAGNKLGSSAKATHVLKHWGISPAPHVKSLSPQLAMLPGESRTFKRGGIMEEERSHGT